MEFRDLYRTIDGQYAAVHRASDSRFMTFAYPVVEAEAANQYIQALRAKHPAARHVCWAWRIGRGGIDHRYGDDGEPSGTAGKQIAGQLIAADVTNIVVAAVRYFGGTLLGTSGLTAAYKTAAKMVLESALIVERYWTKEIRISFDAAAMNHIMKIVKENGIAVGGQEFAMPYTMTLHARESLADAITKKLAVYAQIL
jgi:uncharacterized YigZ family protein